MRRAFSSAGASVAASRGVHVHLHLIAITDGDVRKAPDAPTTYESLCALIGLDPSFPGEPVHYESWDGRATSASVRTHRWLGLDVTVVRKSENRGKKDSLILAQRYIRDYQRRTVPPEHPMVLGFGGNKVAYILGTDTGPSSTSSASRPW